MVCSVARVEGTDCVSSHSFYMPELAETLESEEGLLMYLATCCMLVVKRFGIFQLPSVIFLKRGKVDASSSVSKVCSEAHGKNVSCQVVRGHFLMLPCTN